MNAVISSTAKAVCISLITISVLFGYLELKARFDRSFLLFALTNLLLCCFCAVDIWLYPEKPGLNWLKVQHIMGLFFMLLLVWFIMHITQSVSLAFIKKFFLVNVLFSALLVTDFFFKPGVGGPEATPFYSLIVLPYYLFWLFYLVRLILIRRKSLPDEERVVLKFYLLGLLLLAAFGITDIVTIIFSRPQVPSVSIIGVLLFSVITTNALFDRLVRNFIFKSRKLEKINFQLVKSEKMREILSSTIFHDIANLVAVIKVNLKYLLKESRENSVHRKFLNISFQASQEIQFLASNLLDTGKYEEGELKTNPRRITDDELFTLMERIRNSYLFGEKEIQCQLERPAVRFSIEWDPYLLKRLLQNLINNAFKYTPNKGMIRTYFQVSAREVVLCFFNSGDPIPENKKAALFEKYNGIESRNTSVSRGLGLFFCRMAVQAHQNRIWLETHDGGNCFKVGMTNRP